MFRFCTAAILLLIAALAFASCGDQVRAGYVVDRDFDPAHSYTWYMSVQTGSICSGTGTSHVCTPTYTQVPQQGWEGDKWRLRIKGCKAKEGDYQRKSCNETDRRWLTVNETTYDSVRVGEWYEDR